MLSLFQSLGCLACKMQTSLLLLQSALVPKPVPQVIHHGILKPTELQKGPLLEPLGVVRLLLPNVLEDRRRNVPPCQELRLLSPGKIASMTNWKCVGLSSVLSHSQEASCLEKPSANPTLELPGHQIVLKTN